MGRLSLKVEEATLDWLREMLDRGLFQSAVQA
jgi:hypothetical protein